MNGEQLRRKAEWSKKKRGMVGGKKWIVEKVSWWPQDFKNLCKRTSELERQMKEERDEKNNKTAETGAEEGVWVNGGDGGRGWGGFERREKEETRQTGKGGYKGDLWGRDERWRRSKPWWRRFPTLWSQRQMKNNSDKQVQERDGQKAIQRKSSGQIWECFFGAGGSRTETADKNRKQADLENDEYQRRTGH